MPSMKLTALLAGLVAVRAQIEAPGAPLSLSQSFKLKAQLSEATVRDMAAFAPDVPALLAEEQMAANATGRVSTKAPFKVGVVMPLAASLADFTKDTVTGGDLYRLQVTSPNALGMGANFKTFALTEGCTLHAYNKDATKVRGSYTTANHKHYGGFAITPVPGDTITFELFAPTGAAPKLVLESVVHHYKNTAVKRAGEPTQVQGMPPAAQCFGCSGSCNVNMACPEGAGWEKEADGATRLLTASGGSLCSGAFINNVNEDGKQLYLSANHCGGGNADGWILMFNFQTSTCENGPTAPNRDQTVQGTRLLSRHGLEDFVLLEIVEPVPAAYNAFMTGFDATDEVSFQTPYSISHPSGDVKKMGIFNGIAVPEGYFTTGDSHWFVAAWTAGMTEGGSSGSPLYDSNKRIRGQLHGGRASCAFPFEDYYGRISESWEATPLGSEQLKIHLDPSNTGARIVDGQYLNVLRANQAK